MSLKDDVVEMKREVKAVREQSLAMEMLKDSKKANIRICRSFTIVIITILMMWFTTIGYLIYVLDNISTEQITTEQHIDMDAEGSNNYIGGDNNGEIKNN